MFNINPYVNNTLTSNFYLWIDLIINGTDELALMNPLFGYIFRKPIALTLIYGNHINIYFKDDIIGE